MNETNRNMIIAVVLSVAVLFGWQFFIAGPQQQRAQQAAQLAAEQAAAANPGLATTTTANGTTAPAGTTSATAPASSGTQVFADRPAAIATSPRIQIDTAALKGSINLTGGRLDDLELKNYRETSNPDSPIITLLTTSGVPNGYYI